MPEESIKLHRLFAVDRYIAEPAQAVAYKIGEIKIRGLRARAEKELGEQFNLREFHDVILRKGAIPLSLLEDEVDAYINAPYKGPALPRAARG